MNNHLRPYNHDNYCFRLSSGVIETGHWNFWVFWCLKNFFSSWTKASKGSKIIDGGRGKKSTPPKKMITGPSTVQGKIFWWPFFNWWPFSGGKRFLEQVLRLSPLSTTRPLISTPPQVIHPSHPSNEHSMITDSWTPFNLKRGRRGAPMQTKCLGRVL